VTCDQRIENRGQKTERRVNGSLRLKAAENVQRSTSNAQRSMKERAVSLRVFLGGADAGREYSYEFLSLDQKRADSFCRDEVNSRNETQPSPDFL
jgi:hypothetical protein